MLYNIGWQLVSWVDYRTVFAQLSEEEFRELCAYFQNEKNADRLFSWRVTPITPISKDVLISAYKQDLEDEKKRAEEADGN